MTSPIIPGEILNLFQSEVNKIVEKAVKKICDEYDIDFEEAKELVDIKLTPNIENLHITKKRQPNISKEDRCLARQIRPFGVKQCDLRKKDGQDFCKIHQKCHDNNTLKYGKIDDPLPIDLDDYFLKFKNKNKIY